MVIVMLHRYRNPRLWISLSVKRQVKSNLATFHEDECICGRRRMFRPRRSENARNAQVTYTRTRLRASHIFSVSSSMLSHNLELIGTDMGIYHSKHTRSVIDSGAVSHSPAHLVQQIQLFDTNCVDLVQHIYRRDVFPILSQTVSCLLLILVALFTTALSQSRRTYSLQLHRSNLPTLHQVDESPHSHWTFYIR